MLSAKEVTATFNPGFPTYILRVIKGGSGSGTVTSDPLGIDCGVDCAQQGLSTRMTLTAQPDDGSLFARWSGGGCAGTGLTCTVDMTATRTITAIFNSATIANLLIVSKAGAGSGMVTSSPAGIQCGTNCTESYLPTVFVTLTALPASGSTFTGWSGSEFCPMNATRTCRLRMRDAKNEIATFRAN